MSTLSTEQRNELIDKLTADRVEGSSRMSSDLWHVYKNGIRGFTEYNDDELLQAHEDAFDENFLDEGEKDE